VFFVISGFIITRTAMRKPEGFLANRVARVLPPYYLVLIPWFILSVSHGLDWRRTLASFALWPVTDRYAMPYLFPAWSLCFEALFYFCVWLVLRGVRPRLFISTYAASVALGAMTGWAVFRYLGSPLILEFLLGVAIALSKPVDGRLGLAALCIGAGVIGLYAATGGPAVGHWILLGEGLPVRPVVWGLPAALLVLGAVNLPNLKLGPLPFLGDASYSLYLVHLPVMLYPWPSVWLAVLASVLAGVVFHVVAEGPAIKVARELLLRPRPLATSPASG
jgi:exopolysaccharide production protein ExoZ